MWMTFLFSTYCMWIRSACCRPNCTLQYSTVSVPLTKFYIQYIVFLHRQYLTWNPWTDPMSSSLSMKQASIWQRGEGEAETWLDSGPLLMSCLTRWQCHNLCCYQRPWCSLSPRYTRPYNTQHLLPFLANLRDILFEQQVQELNENPIPTYVIVWDNVRFHRAGQLREWFNIYGQFMNLYLPPYSPFLNLIEEFFSSCRWKVYDRQPYTRVNLLDFACGDIGTRGTRSGLDTAHKRLLAPLPQEGKYCLWCQQSALARPSPKTRRSTLITGLLLWFLNCIL